MSTHLVATILFGVATAIFVLCALIPTADTRLRDAGFAFIAGGLLLGSV